MIRNKAIRPIALECDEMLYVGHPRSNTVDHIQVVRRARTVFLRRCVVAR